MTMTRVCVDWRIELARVAVSGRVDEYQGIGGADCAERGVGCRCVWWAGVVYFAGVINQTVFAILVVNA